MAPRAAILAGGAGSRLGGEKAVVQIAGRSLLAHVVAAARAAGLDPLVVAKPGTRLPALDAEVLLECSPVRHPLAGIAAALEAVPEGVVVVACDMPLVPPGLLAWLASLTELAVCAGPGGVQPLLGRYPPQARERLAAALEHGAPVRHTVAQLCARVLEAELAHFGEPAEILLNVNTPADLERAERLLSGPPR